MPAALRSPSRSARSRTVWRTLGTCSLVFSIYAHLNKAYDAWVVSSQRGIRLSPTERKSFTWAKDRAAALNDANTLRRSEDVDILRPQQSSVRPTRSVQTR